MVWGSKKLNVNVDPNSSVGAFKQVLCGLTGVALQHQKLQGLKGAKDDTLLLRDVVPASKKIALIGQPSEVVSQMVLSQAVLEEEARKEEEERRRRQGALERLQLMRAAEEQKERERYMQSRQEEERARAEEMRVRRENMLRHELEQEMQNGATIEFDMNVFSSAFAPANVKAAGNGDRLVFPASVLSDLIAARIELPVYFKMSANNRVAFCSVSDFSSAPDTVFSPHSYLEFLQIEEGSPVHFETVSLSDAKSIVLRPHNDLWRPLNQSDNGVRLLTGKMKLDHGTNLKRNVFV